jgi:hypothetical protein
MEGRPVNAAMRNAVSGVGGVGGALVGLMAGAPWWALTVCVVLVLGVIALQSVFPQDSADRLAWWKDRRRYREPRPRRGRSPASIPWPSAEGPPRPQLVRSRLDRAGEPAPVARDGAS